MHRQNSASCSEKLKIENEVLPFCFHYPSFGLIIAHPHPFPAFGGELLIESQKSAI
jgi:hypothetical protein